MVIRADRGESSASQQFYLERDKSGGYRILSRNTGNKSCLAGGEKPEGGTGVILEKKDAARDSQVWYLEPLEVSGGRIRTYQTYTAGGRQVETVTDARGKTASYQYDDKGRLLSGVTDPSGVTTSYTYDGNDRVTSVSRPLSGQAVTNGYVYENDRLGSITHNGFSYQFLYDQFGNTKEVKVGEQILSSKTFLPGNGPLKETTYGNGSRNGYTYDGEERVTGATYEGTPYFTYHYDSHGDKIREEDLLNGVTYFFKYDFLGRPVFMTTTAGQELAVRYDNKNRTDQFISSLDGTKVTTEYVYGDPEQDQMPDSAYGVKIDGSQVLTYTYDDLCRRTGRTVNLTKPYTSSYGYLKNGDGSETALVESVTEGGSTWKYTYDDRGNISTVSLGGEERYRYTYDALDELIRVDDAVEGKSHTYAYDMGGNLTSHRTYPYTTGAPGSVLSEDSYAYGDSNWRDKLTAYKGQSFRYDAIGNPLTWRDGITFTWQHGRQLQSYNKNGTSYRYRYDEDGNRMSKQTGDTTTIRRAGSIT